MSGHSHWKSIKHTKEASDKKRGQVFSKLSRQISVATKEGGGDLKTNATLRLAIEKAKQFNLPKENIEKAIKKGTGQLEDVKLENVAYEAYGPGGIAIIIEGITDNKNRALGEIKQILVQHNGKLADTGSMQWLFERKGVASIQITNDYKYTNREELELKVIDAGAEDFCWRDENALEIYTKVEDLERVKKSLEAQGLKIESASLDWVAKEEIGLPEKDKEKCQKLFEALDESETVQEIYSNLKP
jgi:YebC/PmpR family DNA-binding regulatory protein